MAFRYGFYNSIDHDRVYDADQFGDMFSGLITDGIYSTIGDAFAVKPGGGMNITVGTGRCWFDKTWSVNTSVMPIEIKASDLLLPRIDAVIIEIDKRTSVRANSIKVLTGTPAVQPQKPILTNTDEVHQYPLAYITIAQNQESVSATNIQTVIGQDPCPFVTGILESVDITPFWQQWESQFDTWFQNLRTTLGEDAAGALLVMVEDRVKYSDAATKEEISEGTNTRHYITPELLAYSQSGLGQPDGEIILSMSDLQYEYPDKFVKLSGQNLDLDDYPKLRREKLLNYYRIGYSVDSETSISCGYEFPMYLEDGFLVMNKKLYRMSFNGQVKYQISTGLGNVECILHNRIFTITSTGFSVYSIRKDGGNWKTEKLQDVPNTTTVYKIVPIPMENQNDSYVLVFHLSGIAWYNIYTGILTSIDTTGQFVMYKNQTFPYTTYTPHQTGQIWGTQVTNAVNFTTTVYKITDNNIYIFGTNSDKVGYENIGGSSNVKYYTGYIGRIDKRTKALTRTSTKISFYNSVYNTSGNVTILDADFAPNSNYIMLSAHNEHDEDVKAQYQNTSPGRDYAMKTWQYVHAVRMAYNENLANSSSVTTTVTSANMTNTDYGFTAFREYYSISGSRYPAYKQSHFGVACPVINGDVWCFANYISTNSDLTSISNTSQSPSFTSDVIFKVTNYNSQASLTWETGGQKTTLPIAKNNSTLSVTFKTSPIRTTSFSLGSNVSILKPYALTDQKTNDEVVVGVYMPTNGGRGFMQGPTILFPQNIIKVEEVTYGYLKIG